MSRPYVIITDSFKEFKDKVNTVSYNVGDPALLTTEGDSDVVQALNELDSDLHGAGGGNVKADLNYVAYQETVASGTVVGSLNAISSFIGDSANTLTVEASTLVGAINEIEAVFDASATEITSPSNFENYITGTWLVDASSDITLDAGSSTMYWAHNGTNRFTYNLGTTNEVDISGNLVWDVEGDITLDASAGTIFLKDNGVQFGKLVQENSNIDLYSGSTLAIRFSEANQNWYGNVTKSSGPLTIDVEGDIILDAAGGDIILQDDSATFIQFTNVDANNTTVAVTGSLLQTSTGNTEHTTVGDYTIDVTGDVIVEADGEQIKLRKGTTDRFTFNTDATPQLDINGNYTQAVTGFQLNTTSTYMKDSATTNYYLNANSGITIWTAGTYNLTSTGNSIVSSGAHTHTTSGNVSYNVTGSYTVDASTDIILDADGANVTLKDGGATRFDFIMGANQEIDIPTGDLTVDVAGDIILDAEGGDWVLRDSGVDKFKFTSNLQTQTLAVADNFVLDVAGDVTVDADGGDVLIKDAGTTQFQFIAGTNKEIDIPSGDLTVDVAGDIIIDAGGADVDMQVAGTSRVKHTLGATNTVTVNGDYVVDATGDVTIDADGGNVFIKDNAVTQFEFIAGTNKEIDVASGNLTLDVNGDIYLDADGGDIFFHDAGVEAYKFTSTGTISRTGDITIDVSGDITLDADGNDIIFKNGAGADQVTHTLADDASFTIAAPSTYTVDAVGDINLDADGGDVFLKDGGTQFGRFAQANTNQLTVYSGTTAALTFTAGKATINNRAFHTDSALSTAATGVAGGINELKGRMDSADTKAQNILDQYIGGDGGALNTLMSFFDSAGTKDNVIAALNHLGRFAVKVYDENGIVING